MKKLLLISFMLLAMAGSSLAQVVEDFESLKMNLMLGGATDNSTMTVVPNPHNGGLNTTAYVVEYFRSKNGVPWGGFYATAATPVDFTVNKFVHVLVWKSRISPIKFKIEGGTTGALEIASKYPQTVVDGWEDIVFDFRSKTGLYPKVQLMPDFEDPLALTDDITIYFDQIMVNNDSLPNSPSAYMIEDYESIPLNYMLGGPTDNSYMVKVPNPDPNGINISSYVIKFFRSMNGVPWGGFWSTTPVDVTANKYMHVKVWKPRISPVKFKIEGGASGTMEAPSTGPQTSTGVWEDMVFDFSSKTGPYPIIALMPDFEDPLTLTKDIVMYFDDIILNNNPNPIVPPVQKLNVDMHGSKLTAGQPVYLAGDFGGIYGTWNEPGTNANNLMTDPDGDSIYSLTMNLASAIYKFKFFKGTGWNGGEGVSADRTLTVTGDFDHTYKFGQDAVSLTLKVNMKGSKLAGEPVFFAGDFGGMYGVWNEPGTNLNNALTAELPLTDSIYSIVLALDAPGSFQFKFFKAAGWAGGEWAGDPNRKVTVTDDATLSCLWGFKPVTVTFKVNMKGSKLAGEPVYVAGNFGGIYGSWNTPGDNPNNELTALTPATDSIYAITMTLDSIGSYQFKFFKGAGWDGGEWAGGDNRVAKVRVDTTFNFKWGSLFPEGIEENPLAGKIQTYPNPVKEVLNINATTELSQVVITSMVGQEVRRLENFGIGKKTISISELSNGMYFITFYGKSGGQLTQKIMKY